MWSLDQRGFTLIETIIYIGLSGLVMAGVLSAAYPMFTNTEKIVANVTAEGEAAFVVNKISWALSQSVLQSPPTPASPILLPAPDGTPDSQLQINTASGVVSFISNGTDLEVGGLAINASRVPITDFSVKHFSPVANGLPRYVEFTFEANGKSFGPIREYLHF